jgi:cation diffusion facilitator family transporter
VQKISLKNNITLQMVALALGLLLMAAKFIAWWVTNSNAILSDALESIINIVAGAFALYSLILASKPRDKNHPYGHGKIEFISAGFEGALIFLAGMAIIGKAGYNLIYPQGIQQLDTGILLTSIAGAVNYGIGFALEKRGRKSNSLTLIAGGKHLQSDAYSSLGLIIGLALVWWTGILLLDNLIAGAFGCVILFTGFRLLRKSVAGIMDEADYQLIEEIVNKLDSKRNDNWIDVHNFRVIKYGATLHIDCHMTLPWYFNTQEAHSEVKAFEKEAAQLCISPVELFVHVDPCEPASCRICQKKNCAVRRYPAERRINWTLENIMKNTPHDLEEPEKW